MNYQVTIRYGRKTHRYLFLAVEAPDAVAALRKAADEVPVEIAPEVDIVELRPAPDFEKRLPPTTASDAPDQRREGGHPS